MSRRSQPKQKGAKAPSLRSRLELVERNMAHMCSHPVHTLIDAPLVDAPRSGSLLGAGPKMSSFPESLDVINSDLLRLQNLLEAIESRLYGGGQPASSAADAPSPPSVTDKVSLIRSQANHCMNFAESILNRF